MTSRQSKVVDRPRGFLTKADRKFLTGTSGIEPRSDSERQARARVRGRVFHAVLDFAFVADHLEPRDRKLIFESVADFLEEEEQRDTGFSTDNPGEEAGDGRALTSGLADAVALIYQVCHDHQPEQPPDLLTNVVESGVKRAIPTDKNEYVEVEVSISVDTEQVDLEDARRRFEEDDPVSAIELQLLLDEDPTLGF